MILVRRVKGKNVGIGILVIILSIVGFWFLGQRDDGLKYSTEVEQWDNLYEDDNIRFYYIDEEIPEIVHLKGKYEVEKIVQMDDSEIEKALDINSWLKVRCKVTVSTMETNKNAEELLITLNEETMVSQKDYNSILQEMLASIGVKTRVGEYVLEESYSVIEVWDSKLGKWVMIDGIEDGYIKSDNKPLSAVELLDVELDQVIISTNEEDRLLKKSYIKTLKNTLGTYTIKIDNSKYEQSTINSHITYVKNVEDIQLETDKGYIQPTIFVDDAVLFNISPFIEVDSEGDEIPTIIFAKRNVKEDGENYIKFTLGAFMNSSMVEEFYISLNKGEYIKVDTYYDLSIENGSNSIEISLDGINPLRTVKINKE